MKTNEKKLEEAVKKENLKQLSKWDRFKIKSKHLLNNIWEFLIFIDLFPYIWYGLSFMLVLAMVGLEIGIRGFFIGAAFYSIYNLVTQDWNK